jgi:hypothetical protein
MESRSGSIPKEENGFPTIWEVLPPDCGPVTSVAELLLEEVESHLASIAVAGDRVLPSDGSFCYSSYNSFY